MQHLPIFPIPSSFILPPVSLTSMVSSWVCAMGVFGLGVVVGGASVVGGRRSWHRTPAASVRSQSWMDQPSNLGELIVEEILWMNVAFRVSPAVCDLLLSSVAVNVVHPNRVQSVAELRAVSGT